MMLTLVVRTVSHLNRTRISMILPGWNSAFGELC